MANQAIKRNPVSGKGYFIISVSLGAGCYRHIRIKKDVSLDTLSMAILRAFHFDDDHLHAFFMDNRAWSEADAYYHPSVSEDMERLRYSDKYKLSRVLNVGKKFVFVFDFGDDWRFSCRVLREEEGGPDDPVAEVIRVKGDAPEQYPGTDE